MNSTLKRFLTDVAFFVVFWWNQKLSPKQEEFLLAAGEDGHTVFISTRQGGKTHAAALGIILELCVGHIRTGARVIIECYAPTHKQAKEVVFERVRYLLESGMHLTKSGKYINLIDEVKAIKERGHIIMNNGNEFRIQTASATSNVRGYSPTLIVMDESQSIEDSMYWSDIKGAGKAMKGLNADDFEKVRSLPMHEQQDALAEIGIKTRYWELGTPLGRNHFYDMSEPGAETTVIMQPWWECPFINKKQLEEDRVTMPLKQFEAEYCCIFYSDMERAFDKKHIMRACVMDEAGLHMPKGDRMYFMGIDLGQKVDHSVVTVMEVYSPTLLREVHTRVFDLHEKWADMVREMYEIYQAWQPEICLVDGTGAHYYVNFIGEAQHYRWNVVPYLFTRATKARLFRNLQLMFEKNRLELHNRLTLIRQLNSIEEKHTPGTAEPQYPKPEEGDDQVDAIALACYGASFHLMDDQVQFHHFHEATQHYDVNTRHPAPVGWDQPKERGSIWDDGHRWGSERTTRWDGDNPFDI